MTGHVMSSGSTHPLSHAFCIPRIQVRFGPVFLAQGLSCSCSEAIVQDCSHLRVQLGPKALLSRSSMWRGQPLNFQTHPWAAFPCGCQFCCIRVSEPWFTIFYERQVNPSFLPSPWQGDITPSHNYWNGDGRLPPPSTPTLILASQQLCILHRIVIHRCIYVFFHHYNEKPEEEHLVKKRGLLDTVWEAESLNC